MHKKIRRQFPGIQFRKMLVLVTPLPMACKIWT
jgi:hypothetical protein